MGLVSFQGFFYFIFIGLPILYFGTCHQGANQSASLLSADHGLGKVQWAERCQRAMCGLLA